MSDLPDGYYKGRKTGSMSKSFNKKETETLEDIATYPCLAIEERGITKKTAEHFGVRTALSTSDGETPIAHYFPYTLDGKVVGYKKRDLTVPKQQKNHFSAIGFQGVKCDLFGTNCGNSSGGKKIFITEGEYDAMICYQTLKEEYSRTNPTVVSISSGTANAVQNIGQKQNMKLISKFQETVIVFDNDSATLTEKEKGIKKGKEATADVYGLLPEILVAPLPDGKDPCETYKDNSQKELYWMLVKPIQYTPEGFIKYDEIRSKAIELPVLGKSWPWRSVTKRTLGRRLGEGIYMGAGVKMGKCFSADTMIRMYDGSVKTVQDVEIGDEVMGWDSSKRVVLETHSGRDTMYEVQQLQGCNYTVNSQHTLVLRDSGDKGKLIERSVDDLFSSYKGKKDSSVSLRDLKGIHSTIEYPERALPVDPYTLGVWLGDGSRSDNRITLFDKDAKYISNYCKENITLHHKPEKNSYDGCIVGKKSYFKTFDKVKRVPQDVLLNSIEVRKNLLAGWIDTDGYKREENQYEIITKDDALASTGVELMRSLGFKVSVTRVIKTIKKSGFCGEYNKINLSGDFTNIPIQVPRKQSSKRPVKDSSRTGISILYKGLGDYYGFEVDGDHKFVLEDYTVVHNSVVVDTITEYIIKHDKNSLGEAQKVALFKFEEQPDETVKKVAGKFYRKDFSNPEKIIFIDKDSNEVDVWGEPIKDKSSYFTPKELEDAVDSVGNSIVMYNNYGRCNWDELKGAIRHAVLVEHIEDIFIDPITRLTAGMSASDANTELERFADEISKMAQDLGFTYYCFCHLKAPSQGAPHEFGGKVQSSQFRGSRAMMQACYYMMGLEGNKDPDEPEKVQNTRYLVILDDRKYGRTARIPLFYDVDTGILAEPPEGFLEDEDCQTLKEWYAKYPDGKPDVENF